MSIAIRREDAPGLALVAVGGNALTGVDQTGTAEEIGANAEAVGECLTALHDAGWGLAVVHGNGPQVGNLAIQQDEGRTLVPPQPLHQLCAMTQGQLGSVLVRAVDRRCGAGTAVGVLTHMIVDTDDPAFTDPAKPIGPFFSADTAAELAADRGWTMVSDSGRGHRRVVASPAPREVVEVAAITALLAAGHVVVAAGGGGIAVARDADGRLVGVEAIIDKDHAAAALAIAIGATELYLLTAVDAVQLDFGTPDPHPAHHLDATQARRHLDNGQFPPGSMGPKVAAALRFLDGGGERAIITSVAVLPAALARQPGAGTSITSGAAPVPTTAPESP